MKPRPNLSVNEWLAMGTERTESILPYDVYTHQTSNFVTFAVGDEFIAFPLAALGKASLRASFTSIALEFGSVLVRIEGRGLDGPFESILRAQVRVVRTGQHPDCAIDSIRLAETVSL